MGKLAVIARSTATKQSLHSCHPELACPTEAGRRRDSGSRFRIKYGMTKHAGFTLVEILIVMGLITMIAAFGLFISMDVYRGNTIHSEKNIVISVLQKARSRTINNINERKHGVRFGISPDCTDGQRCYILFEGNNWASATNKEEIPASHDLVIDNGAGGPAPDVIFSQLTAETTNATVRMMGGAKTFKITVNAEGGISWINL